VVTLFPDDYPPTGPPAADSDRDQPRACCDPWAEHCQQEEPALVWEIVHGLGHSRVPFTAGTVAELADVTPHHARWVINTAVGSGWVAPVPPEHYMDQRQPTGLWRGLLPRRR
jgi:hypothetical protein